MKKSKINQKSLTQPSDGWVERGAVTGEDCSSELRKAETLRLLREIAAGTEQVYKELQSYNPIMEISDKDYSTLDAFHLWLKHFEERVEPEDENYNGREII